MVINTCKSAFKEQNWWSVVKIYTVGRKLKIRTPTADGQEFTNTFLNLRGYHSPFDETLKAKILDLVSKVKSVSTAPNEEDNKPDDDSI